MNRRERRREEAEARRQARRQPWCKLNPRGTYSELCEEMDDDTRRVLMALMRELCGGQDFPMGDEELWNSIRGLITKGVMDIYIRVTDTHIEMQPEFYIPEEYYEGGAPR